MNIDPKARLAGVPIVEVRDFLRKHAERGWEPDELHARFGRERADQLLGVLAAEQYVEEIDLCGTPGYGNTVKGGQLANASAGRPVSRATAQRALNEFLARCEQVREGPDYLYTVQKAILFGSMLTEKATVSDVDLAIALRRKEPDPVRHFALMQEQSRQAVREGRQFSNLVERLGYADTRVRRFLKGRSRVLQFTTTDDAILEGTATKVIFVDLA